MENRLRLPLCALLLVLPLTLAALPKVAVLDVTLSKEVDQSLVVPVTETIMELVVGSKAYTVLDRAYVEQVLKEKEFQLSGLVSDAQVAQAGQYLGADFVIAGKGQLAAGSYFLVAKMIEVRTGVIAAQATEQAEGKVLVLLELARKLGAKLVAGGAGQSSAAAGSGTAVPAAGATAAPAASAAPGRLRVGVLHDNSGLSTRGFPLPLEYARIYAEERLGQKVEFLAVHDLRPEASAAAIDELVAKGCAVIFSLPPSFDPALVLAAGKYPAVRFAMVSHSFPGARPANLHAVFGDTRGINYVLGLLAGAASKSGKLGYLAVVPDPWQQRLINEFALGVRAVNAKATVLVRYRGWDWSMEKGLLLAKALVAEGCDSFGPLNFSNVLDYFASEAARGKPVYAIGEEQPWAYQPATMITGPTMNWGPLFVEFLLPLLAGQVPPADLYLGLEKAVGCLGWPGQEAVNPGLRALLAARKVKTPDLGELNAVDLALRRIDQIRSWQFEIFTGPLKDQKGKQRLAAGDRPAGEQFFAEMDWLLDNVRTEAK